MASNKTQIAYDDSFHFGGHHIYVQFVEPDGYTEQLIEGKVRSERRSSTPDYSFAHIALLQRCVHELKKDQKPVSLDPDARGRSKFPRIWDEDVQESLSRYLLKLIIKHVDPTMAQQFPEAFEEFEEQEENPGAGFTTQGRGASAPTPLPRQEAAAE